MFELIGETLRRLRKERGLTLDKLGRAAELGRGQLSRIENNKQEATFSTLAKILNSQGVSRREFFRRYDLVESEALAVKRQSTSSGLAEGDWPEEVKGVLSKIESFVQITLHQPRPVAQGAIEVGDLVVLFRVVPKDAGAASPPKGEATDGADDEPAPRSRSTRPAGGRGRRRKR